MNDIFWIGKLESFGLEITPDTIIQKCDNLQMHEATIANQFNSAEVRRSEVAFLQDKHSPIHNLMYDIATVVNNQCFGFNIKSVGNIQYSIYNEKNLGKYDWHMDTNFLNNDFSQRKLSIVVQLSNPKDYEGGQLELDVDDYGVTWADFQEYANKKGAVIVFPSFLKHRITPVTKGIRKSLITWIIGNNFK